MAAGEYASYDREALYEQVWAEPKRDLAKKYGVSDVALAKTCRRLSVPVPGRGYWAKKSARKAPKRPPLPAYDDPKSIPPTRQRASTSPLTAEDRRPPTPTVPVPDALRRPHALVVAARDALKEAHAIPAMQEEAAALIEGLVFAEA